MILITGASGTVGSEVVRQLEAHGTTVRAMTRGTLCLRVSPNVEPVFADLTKPETLTAAMAGVTHLYLITAAAPTAQHVQMQLNALDAASTAGVQHVVAQSVQFAAPEAPVEVMRSHAPL